VLRALSTKDVVSVFAAFGAGTVNEELLFSLRNASASAGAPCVFRTNSPLATIPVVPADATTTAATLNRAAALLGGTVEQRHESVALVESVLRAIHPPVDWPMAQWAALAASAALDLGDVERAGQLAALAVELEPANVQAGYVARVINRERQLRQTNVGRGGTIDPNR